MPQTSKKATKQTIDLSKDWDHCHKTDLQKLPLKVGQWLEEKKVRQEQPANQGETEPHHSKETNVSSLNSITYLNLPPHTCFVICHYIYHEGVLQCLLQFKEGSKMYVLNIASLRRVHLVWTLTYTRLLHIGTYPSMKCVVHIRKQSITDPLRLSLQEFWRHSPWLQK